MKLVAFLSFYFVFHSQISTRLTKLHSVLGCPVLLTEGVYEAVQNKFGAISLDNVWVEDQDTSLKVYGLVQSSPLQAQHAKVYKQAFSYLLQVLVLRAGQGGAGAAMFPLSCPVARPWSRIRALVHVFRNLIRRFE